MIVTQLKSTARALVSPGKGILAADESHPTIGRRFAPSASRTPKRTAGSTGEMLFTRKGSAEFISGVILFDETIRQAAPTTARRSAKVLLGKRASSPASRSTPATKPLPAPGEQVTEGLDGLRERMRGVPRPGRALRQVARRHHHRPGIPSRHCIDANAHALARYAALARKRALVPIVEPEVLMDGDHNIERCDEVTEGDARAVFSELDAPAVSLEGMILKPNMVLSGKPCRARPACSEVARSDLRCFRRTVPAAVPGMVFLSGGQSDELATAHLDAMNAAGPHPWPLTFSYGRALQAAALKAWKGEPDAFRGPEGVPPPRAVQRRGPVRPVRGQMERAGA